ncbi:MAG: hypothetical protein OMM_15106, partial [Candidatus Magnetoglobus multicellularis str. Araruama]
GDIIIENIDAGSKNVGIYSNSGNVYTSSQSTINIISENLRMESEGHIGTITKHLNTLTDSVAVKSSGNIFITDQSALSIESIDPIEVQRVQMYESRLAVTDDTQLSGITSSKADANIVIQTLSDDLVVNNLVLSIGEGTIHLIAESGDIVLNDNVHADSGQLTITAKESIIQNANLINKGDIALVAEDGSISVRFIESLGNVTLIATSGDIIDTDD